MFSVFCFFKQKTAYEMRISDWSSDVCSSDLIGLWQQVKDKLGFLLMRWDNGCLETNLIPHLADDQLDAFIRDPDGDDGERLRTLADRAGSQDKSLAAIQAATDNIRQLKIGRDHV